MKRLFAGLRKRSGQGTRSDRDTRSGRDRQPKDDQRFGTGMWRHNRDRFVRAVDRYYTTALALHEARTNAPSKSATPEGVPAAEDPIDLIVDGTHRLNALVSLVDEITEELHTRHPVTGQIVPGPARRDLGSTPELLTQASAKVAEAVLAASMARTEAAADKPIASTARATQHFIADAADLLERAQENLVRLEGS